MADRPEQAATENAAVRHCATAGNVEEHYVVAAGDWPLVPFLALSSIPELTVSR